MVKVNTISSDAIAQIIKSNSPTTRYFTLEGMPEFKSIITTDAKQKHRSLCIRWVRTTRGFPRHQHTDTTKSMRLRFRLILRSCSVKSVLHPRAPGTLNKLSLSQLYT